MPSVLGNTPLGASIALESDLEQQVVAVGKPFDAECEYVTVPAGAYIDPDVLFYDASLGVEATFRIPSSPTPGDGSFKCGTWTGSGSSSYQLFINTSDKLRILRYSTSLVQISNAPFVGSFGTAKINGNEMSNGTASATVSSASSGGTPLNFLICALSDSNNAVSNICTHDVDFSAFKFMFSGVSFRDLVPVRVGTVGYLYDKLSGRLFGSAVGSIPLVPGPDVSTPTFTPKTEIDLLAPLASPAFTGTPTAPTASSGTNTTQVATTAFVQTAVSGKANTNHTHQSIVSSSSTTSVTANDDGTATISHTTASELGPPLVEFDNFSGYTGSVQMKGPFTTQEGWWGYVSDSVPDPTDMFGFMSGWAIVAPEVGFRDHPMLWNDGNEASVLVYDIDTATPEARSYAQQSVSSITITRSGTPPVTTVERVLTESDLGDIDAVLDAINGEVV